MNKLLVSEKVDPDTWNEHATRLNGTFTHTYEYSLFTTEIYQTKPLYFAYEDNNGKFQAIAVGRMGAKQKAGFSFFKTLSFGSLPACNDDNTRNRMIKLLYEYAHKNGIMELSINSFSTPYDMEVVKELGFSIKQRWEFLLPLDLPEEDIWKKKIQSKKRNMIRKGEKNGVVVKEKKQINDLLEFRKLNQKTYARKKNKNITYPKAAGLSYYRTLKELLIDQSIAKLYLAYKDEKMIAGALFCVFNKTVYYMLSAANDDGLKLAAPDTILWKAITDHLVKKFLLFNFGGISEELLKGGELEKSGLYRFKKLFGTSVTPCYNSKIVLRPFVQRIYATLKNIR